MFPQIHVARGANRLNDTASSQQSEKKFAIYDEDGKRTYPSPPPKKLPSFTEAYMSSPSTAGIPVLEIVRRLEEEKTLRKEDREALNEALHDSNRREKIIKTLGDVELGVNPKFAIKRLRALIYGNMAGEISSRAFQHKKDQVTANYGIPQFNADQENSNLIQDEVIEVAQPVSVRNAPVMDNEPPTATPMGSVTRVPHPPSNASVGAPSESLKNNGRSVKETKEVLQSHDDATVGSVSYTLSTVEKVVGTTPFYSGPDNYNVMNKIGRNLHAFLQKRGAQHKITSIKLAVIVGSGSYNPLTRMHMRTFFVAKEYLESRCGFFVLGSLLCPAHGATVRERYRTDITEVIPSPHRVAIAQLMVEESRWLTIDPWEITRRRAMDYMSLLQHTAEMVRNHFNIEFDIKILYLCKANMVPKLSPLAMRNEGFGCVCVCRAPDSDYLRDSLNSKWSGLIYVVEDTAILDASFDMVTSRKVRDKIKAGESVENLVGKKVQDYIKSERLGPKMNRLEEWGDAEKFLPKIESRRPITRPKPNLQKY